MDNYKKLVNITGWVVFAIAMIVYIMSAERTGSLWDCGEFVAGAHKLQVVHPPGAALFLIIGRMFTFVAETISDNPSNIAFAVNLMSGMCAAFTAMFVCWSTIILSKLALVGRDAVVDNEQKIPLAASGLVAGLATAFSTSIWFSAVEGEVYAMSTFFTALTVWAVIKWYNLPDKPESDRWIVFAVFAAALSTGVHLLSLLTFPALALFYYFKKYKDHTFMGLVFASGVGVAMIVGIQFFVIIGIPELWAMLEMMMVNGFGMPHQSGLVPLVLIVGGVLFAGLKYADGKQNGLVHMLFFTTALVVIGFSTVGVVVIRANANTPINMNNPNDPLRLVPYLNREQYGERPLLSGPTFDAQVIGTDSEDRYGLVVGPNGEESYEVVDQRLSYRYNPKDKIFFPRIGHAEQGRKQIHRDVWMGGKTGKPDQSDNISFFMRYQVSWMYLRYFNWNFIGRQNAAQGFEPGNKTSGHWMSGIAAFDSQKLYNQSELPDTIKNDKSRNKYYFLPLIFGLIGMLWHARRSREEFLALMGLFIITGIGIIVYSNQPPREPRERDYVLVGSFFTFCMWIGMAVPALYSMMKEKLDVKGVSGVVAAAVVLSAPLIMGFENFDDHSRAKHTGSRDYASNFLHSVDQNAIIFTYGDNDTYPLWYAQEVEGIRTDVRVVNLSLIAVDWYIDQLRRKVNDSPAIKMTVGSEAIRGNKRNQVPVYSRDQSHRPMNALAALKFVNETHRLPTASGNTFESYIPSKNLFIPVNKNQVYANGTVNPADSLTVVNQIPVTLSESYLLKGQVAVLDILASNAFERPVYFAVTVQPSTLLGLRDYMELEGLAMRFVPVKSRTDGNYGLIGSGRVDLATVEDNVMNKFKWGNFDKEEMFIDRSYGPSIQSQRLLMMRYANASLATGQPDRAVAMCEKYFEAFPHMNFRYNAQTMPFIQILVQANRYDLAKKHIEILAEETRQHLNFYYSLDQDDLQAGFGRDFASFNQTKDDLIRMVQAGKDDAYAKELQTMFQEYSVNNVPN